MRYYIDDDGDYLSVDHATAAYYRRIGQPLMREARATAIAGNRMSVCTCSVSVDYLREHCTPIPKTSVPAQWMDLL